MDACRNVWRAAINSLYKVCLQCSGKQSLHHACSQAVIPDPDPAAASFTPHMVTSQEIQPIQTSHSKAKSCSNLIHITSYVIPSILPKEKNVHKKSLSPWKGFPGDAGGNAMDLLPCMQAEWASGPRWAPHGMDPCPHLPRPGEIFGISQPLLPSVLRED